MSNEQNDFWGDGADWEPGSGLGRHSSRPALGATVHSWWSSLLGGGTTAHRTHGLPLANDRSVGARGDAATSPFDFDDTDPSAERPALEETAGPAAFEFDRQEEIEAWNFDPTTEVPAVFDAARGDADAHADHAAAADDEWDDAWDLSDEPPPVPVDPLLARMGALAIVVTLLIPIGLSLRSGGEAELIESAEVAQSSIVTSSQAAVSTADSASTVEVAATEETAAATNTPATASVIADTAPLTAVSAASTVDAADATPAPPAESAAAKAVADPVVDAPAAAGSGGVRIEPACPIEYEVVPGDFWIRIADGSGATLDDLLAVNGATTRTPLFPGETICLPAGSTIPPPPPPTTAPPTTAPPTTAPPTTAPPTTAPPTTAPPTTAPPSEPPGPEAVKQIIRDIWPDELEAKALDVAYRESRFDPLADNNFCCYGLFQIYWSVHQGWLASDLGITSVNQLFDAETNTRAAYALYQRAGGWGPWGG